MCVHNNFLLTGCIHNMCNVKKAHCSLCYKLCLLLILSLRNTDFSTTASGSLIGIFKQISLKKTQYSTQGKAKIYVRMLRFLLMRVAAYIVTTLFWGRGLILSPKRPDRKTQTTGNLKDECPHAHLFEQRHPSKKVSQSRKVS